MIDIKSVLKVSMQDMLKAGVHFGHRTRFWNPKMKPYIYGTRNKMHILNLDHTMAAYYSAAQFLLDLSMRNSKILFVGTKNAAKDIIKTQAERLSMPYVNHRWLGGMLTNWRTVRQSIRRLKEWERMQVRGHVDDMKKKEQLMFERNLIKSQRSLDGVKEMGGLPDALFVIDVGYESLAVTEAHKLGIPVIGIVDTNADPDMIDYPIPGNDDAIRAIKLYVESLADALLAAKGMVQEKNKAASVKTEKKNVVTSEANQESSSDK